ncbi:hypothetical protein CYG49_00190, partial [Candidatus Saccharibacteria bacterium]
GVFFLSMGRLWGRTQNNSRISTEWGHDGRKNEEYQRLLIDELTDQSERLAAPMQNKFFYHLDRAGRLVSEFGDEIIPVLERGLQAAVVEARNRPDITFEVERRALELDETRLLEALARGEIDKTTLVVVSPIPDAVRFGVTTIDGYDR